MTTRPSKMAPPAENGDSLLKQTRKSRGLSLETVAAAVGTDKSNLRRVEEGLQVPQQVLARNLFKYYGGAVPLASIYDPKFDHPARA